MKGNVTSHIGNKRQRQNSSGVKTVENKADRKTTAIENCRRPGRPSIYKTLKSQLIRFASRTHFVVEKFTHDIIDPYCTIKLSTTGEIQTTKPVRDGGSNVVWTHEHNNVLRFAYTFDQNVCNESSFLSSKTKDGGDNDEASNSSSVGSEQDENLDDGIGMLYFDIFDQDIILDAHIGGTHLRLKNILKNIVGSDSKSLSERVIVPQQPIEIPVFRKSDGAISGFLRAKIHFEYEGTNSSIGEDGTTLKNIINGNLVVTVESGADLWDPNSPEEWLPSDPHAGRSVFVSLFICLLYFIGGSLMFMAVEGWDFWDAMYFGAATFTTVGYGSPAPISALGRAVASLYMIFGVTMVSVSIVRLWLAMLSSCGGPCSHFFRLVGQECSLICPCYNACLSKEGRHKNRVEYNERPEYQSSRHRKDEGATTNLKDVKKPATLVYVSVVAALKLFALVSFGAVFYMIFPGENLSFTDSVYMSTATVMTVGYGDLSPKTQGGKIVATWWMIISYAILLRALQDVSNTIHTRRLNQVRSQLLNRDLSRAAILNMDKDGDGNLSRLEFLTSMVVTLKLCTEEHLNAIMKRFDEVEQSREARERVLKELQKFRSKPNNSPRNHNQQHHDWRSAAGKVRPLGKQRLLAQKLEQETIHAAETMGHIQHEHYNDKGIEKDTIALNINVTPSKTVEMTEKNLVSVKKISGEQKERPLVRVKTYHAINGDRYVNDRSIGNRTKVAPYFKKLRKRKETKETNQAMENMLGNKEAESTPSVGPSSSSPSCSQIACNEDLDPEQRDNSLSTMLAYLRRARDASRRYIEEQATAGENIAQRRLAIKAYRDLLETLHRQQKFAHDLLEATDPEVLRLHEGNAPAKSPAKCKNSNEK
jgi:hypothetical protein